MKNEKYILAFDTANEQITIALGKIEAKAIKLTASCVEYSHRESNTKLIPLIEEMLQTKKINLSEISYIAVGRGPGSFTGIRIAMASAKGIACALNIALIGFNTLDAVAWNLWEHNYRGHIYVVADAMRSEIYPALFESTEKGIIKLSTNKVLKAQKCADEAFDIVGKCNNLIVAGDALTKYFDMFEGLNIADQELWNPSATSLLLTIQNKISDSIDTFKSQQILPIYTRLSDAEEGERIRLSKTNSDDLKTGVKALPNNDEIKFSPLTKNHINGMENLEKKLFTSDAWNANKFIAELNQKNRSWWIATKAEKVIGYAGCMHTDNKMEILKIAVRPDYQHKGLAKKLLSLCANDMRDLGAQSTILEVRKSNTNARNFYEHLGIMQIALRPKYYSDGEDALLMVGPLPLQENDIAGMEVQSNNKPGSHNIKHPIIFSVESSCDETACAITCDGEVISDCVASQIDFHKRFGGVVPEIASRKHIEAICALAQITLEKARKTLNNSNFNWKDMDAIAVTYAPGLVGALVVGLAFAKGLSFASQKPLICVNHLEGHLYANKLTAKDIKLPAVASIISGGNTMLIEVKNWGDYKTLGTTIDDAVGEAFDKIAKYLGLGYPGGPKISKLAKKGNATAIKFPRAIINSDDYQFSLSGLKTAVINYIEKHHNDDDFNLADICASFEQAIIDVQVKKARRAIHETKSKSFLFGGGVAANAELRNAYQQMCDHESVALIMAPLSACGDNAVMIGLVANDLYKQNKFSKLDIDVKAHAPL